MATTPAEKLESITLETADNPDSAIIWLHGLGADGNDFVPIVDQLQLPSELAIRFIFPHAPIRPVSLNQGYPMRSWYDLYGLSFNEREDAPGIHAAAEQIMQLCQQQQDAGIASQRIFLAGFSQGGALALYTGLRYPQPLGGIIALSTYLCLHDTLTTEMSPYATQLPVFMAHGLQDEVLPFDFGKKSAELLQSVGIPVDWHDYAMGHSVCPQEIQAIRQWLTLNAIG